VLARDGSLSLRRRSGERVRERGFGAAHFR
jgi:hypothetical protein